MQPSPLSYVKKNQHVKAAVLSFPAAGAEGWAPLWMGWAMWVG